MNEKTLELLFESCKKTKTLLNATTDFIVLLSSDGTILIGNEISAARFGKGVEEFIGLNISEIMERDLYERRKGLLDEVIRKGKPLRFEDEREGLILDNCAYPLFDNQCH